jgi:hypothetical protein
MKVFFTNRIEENDSWVATVFRHAIPSSKDGGTKRHQHVNSY